ncbi:hypothetical protein E4U32_005361, partial [Claviceps aff. humidiphila group G2b]
SVWETSRASGKEGHAYLAAANPHQETTIVEIDGDTLCVLEEAKHHYKRQPFSRLAEE